MEWLTLLVDLGGAVIPWMVTFLIGVIIRYGTSKIKNDYISGVLGRATEEVFRSAEEIYQTFVKGIKAGRADGKLTDAEKEMAKNKAIEAAKSNLGPKGLAKLVKILGGAEGTTKWLSNRVEGSVAALKKEGKLVAEKK